MTELRNGFLERFNRSSSSTHTISECGALAREVYGDARVVCFRRQDGKACVHTSQGTELFDTIDALYAELERRKS